jgi:hypothetical protein
VRLDGRALCPLAGLLLGRGATDATAGMEVAGRGTIGAGLALVVAALLASRTSSLPIGLGGGRFFAGTDGTLRRASGKSMAGGGNAGRARMKPCA